MPHSVLYQCLGIHGYHHLRSWSCGGSPYLRVVRTKKRCGACQSWKVIQKDYRWRKLRVLPIGPKPVFVVVKMRRIFVRNAARFARKLRRHAKGILNCFLFPISTAQVEGINNRIKVIKRKAYGYRDLNYIKLKIYNLHTSRYSKT